MLGEFGALALSIACRCVFVLSCVKWDDCSIYFPFPGALARLVSPTGSSLDASRTAGVDVRKKDGLFVLGRCQWSMVNGLVPSKMHKIFAHT